MSINVSVGQAAIFFAVALPFADSQHDWRALSRD